MAKTSRSNSYLYAHKVPPMLLVWLYVSLPLVLWDTSYVFLRPHSMPGGKYHSPIWKLYALYGTVDYVYGWPAYDSHVGFTAAQASLNVVETAMYFFYLAAIYVNGSGNFFQTRDVKSFFLGEERNSVSGPGVASGVLYLFSAAIMTLSKTVLYCKCDLPPWISREFKPLINCSMPSANLFYLQGSMNTSRDLPTLGTTPRTILSCCGLFPTDSG